jgi:hypothetical protein
MNDLTVLTPPLLMAAAVITGIVMFLRHEMARGRSGRADLEDDIPTAESGSGATADNDSEGAEAAATPGTES